MLFFVSFILSWLLLLIAILTRRSGVFKKVAYACVGVNIVALIVLILLGRLV
jgi:hypothetical protein